MGTKIYKFPGAKDREWKEFWVPILDAVIGTLNLNDYPASIKDKVVQLFSDGCKTAFMGVVNSESTVKYNFVPDLYCKDPEQVKKYFNEVDKFYQDRFEKLIISLMRTNFEYCLELAILKEELQRATSKFSPQSTKTE